MPRFTYIALDSRGLESTGRVEAVSTDDAIGQLRQAGFFPTNIYEEGKGGRLETEAIKHASKAARVGESREKRKSIILFQRKKVKPKILAIFTRQLATLIDSGLPYCAV
jgi:type IV pilus assembly protein PilC